MSRERQFFDGAARAFYAPLRSIRAEKRWEGRQRTLETRAQRKLSKDRLEGK